MRGLEQIPWLYDTLCAARGAAGAAGPGAGRGAAVPRRRLRHGGERALLLQRRRPGARVRGGPARARPRGRTSHAGARPVEDAVEGAAPGSAPALLDAPGRDLVRAAPALGLEAPADAGAHLMWEAEGVEPPGDALEDPALVPVGDAGARPVVVGEAPLHLDPVRALGEPPDAA